MTDGQNYRGIIIDLVQDVAGQVDVLSFPRAFIGFTGSIEGAILLSKIIQHQEHSGQDGGRLFKTYADWEKELGLSKYKVSGLSAEMRGKGFLETRVKRANGNPTVHYFLDRNEFEKQLVDYLRKQSAPESLTNEGAHNGPETL